MSEEEWNSAGLPLHEKRICSEDMRELPWEATIPTNAIMVKAVPADFDMPKQTAGISPMTANAGAGVEATRSKFLAFIETIQGAHSTAETEQRISIRRLRGESIPFARTKLVTGCPLGLRRQGSRFRLLAQSRGHLRHSKLLNLGNRECFAGCVMPPPTIPVPAESPDFNLTLQRFPKGRCSSRALSRPLRKPYRS